jgi:hypothetical protein
MVRVLDRLPGRQIPRLVTCKLYSRPSVIVDSIDLNTRYVPTQLYLRPMLIQTSSSAQLVRLCWWLPLAAPARALAPDGCCTYCVHDARFRYGSRRGTSVAVGCSFFDGALNLQCSTVAPDYLIWPRKNASTSVRRSIPARAHVKVHATMPASCLLRALGPLPWAMPENLTAVTYKQHYLRCANRAGRAGLTVAEYGHLDTPKASMSIYSTSRYL